MVTEEAADLGQRLSLRLSYCVEFFKKINASFYENVHAFRRGNMPLACIARFGVDDIQARS